MIKLQTKTPRWVSVQTKWGRVQVWRDDGMLPLFSERYGYVRKWRILGLVVKWSHG